MKITIDINDKAVNVIKSVFTKRNAIIGIVALFFIGGVFVFSQAALTKPHNFSDGEVISAKEMNENFDVLYEKVNELDAVLNYVAPVFGYVPVGSIVAWHKDMTGTPPDLPEGWVECNGQAIDDYESIYFNLIAPNLNGAPDGANSPNLTRKEQMFLRGGLESGNGQQATSILEATLEDSSNRMKNTDGLDGAELNKYVSIYQNGFGSYVYHKVRPVNMSVVWIMRIK